MTKKLFGHQSHIGRIHFIVYISKNYITKTCFFFLKCKNRVVDNVQTFIIKTTSDHVISRIYEWHSYPNKTPCLQLAASHSISWLQTICLKSRNTKLWLPSRSLHSTLLMIRLIFAISVDPRSLIQRLFLVVILLGNVLIM